MIVIVIIIICLFGTFCFWEYIDSKEAHTKKEGKIVYYKKYTKELNNSYICISAYIRLFGENYVMEIDDSGNEPPHETCWINVYKVENEIFFRELRKLRAEAEAETMKILIERFNKTE